MIFEGQKEDLITKKTWLFLTHVPFSISYSGLSVLPQQHHHHHAVRGRAVASGHQRGPLGPTAERRAAPQEAGPLPRLREGVDRVLPRHRPHQGQEGVQAWVWGLLRVHAQAEAGKCEKGREGILDDDVAVAFDNRVIWNVVYAKLVSKNQLSSIVDALVWIPLDNITLDFFFSSVKWFPGQ